MRVDRLRGVLERMRRELLPVFDDRLVLKKLTKEGEKVNDELSTFIENAIKERKKHLINIFSPHKQLFLLPLRQKAEFGAHKEDLAGTSPHDGGCSTE